jgi:hypothetical protein
MSAFEQVPGVFMFSCRDASEHVVTEVNKNAMSIKI